MSSKLRDNHNQDLNLCKEVSQALGVDPFRSYKKLFHCSGRVEVEGG